MSDSKTLVVIGGSSGIGLRTAQVAAAQGARVIIGGRDRRRLDEALKTLPQNAIARQVDAFSSTSLTAFFDDLPVVDMLFTPGTNYTVTPSPRRRRNRRAARSRASSGRILGRARGPAQTGAGRLGAADVGRGQRASRQGGAAAAANAAIEGLARGWPPSWRRAASTRSRPAP